MVHATVCSLVYQNITLSVKQPVEIRTTAILPWKHKEEQVRLGRCERTQFVEPDWKDSSPEDWYPEPVWTPTGRGSHISWYIPYFLLCVSKLGQCQNNKKEKIYILKTCFVSGSQDFICKIFKKKKCSEIFRMHFKRVNIQLGAFGFEDLAHSTMLLLPPHHHHHHLQGNIKRIFEHYRNFMASLAWAKKLDVGNSPDVRTSLPHKNDKQIEIGCCLLTGGGTEHLERFFCWLFTGFCSLRVGVLVTLGLGALRHAVFWRSFLWFRLSCSIWVAGRGQRGEKERGEKEKRDDTGVSGSSFSSPTEFRITNGIFAEGNSDIKWPYSTLSGSPSICWKPAASSSSRLGRLLVFSHQTLCIVLRNILVQEGR